MEKIAPINEQQIKTSQKACLEQAGCLFHRDYWRGRDSRRQTTDNSQQSTVNSQQLTDQ
ncbi:MULTISPECIES: hypothetical protein [unclassified Microcoleus]|uniref:hypothetical protein n=1 Tax=unclassified Microcoleus TaxID=2642155 RepID=UPI002FD74C23